MRWQRTLAFALVLAACSRTPSAPTEIPVSSTPTTAPTATTLSDTTTVTTSPPSTTATPVLPDLPRLDDGANICSLYGEPTQLSKVTDISLIEVSGIAASRDHPGVLWAVNDSGDGPTIYAISEGDTIATVTLNGVFPIDWEDLDLGPGPGGIDHLYVADVGDNLGFRPWISIFRLPEPDPTQRSDLSHTADELELIYPDAEGIDTEAMAVDPATGDAIIIPKDLGAVGMYRASADILGRGERATMERIGTLDLGAEITSAAFSASGDRLVLRGYKTIWVWLRTDLDISEVIAQEPCETSAAEERQGEALTLLADNSIVTISEGGRPPINVVPVVDG